MARLITFFLSAEELSCLIRKASGEGKYVDTSFGPRGVWLEWETDQEMPWAIEQLLLMRGVLNENMDGAGI